MRMRGLWVHVGLLAVACVASFYVWSRDKKATAAAVADVTVWGGRPEDVQRIAFESSTTKVSLEARQDAQGRWFFGTVERASSPISDAGAPPPRKTTTFASVAAAQKVAQALAPFRALRFIGAVDNQRAGEFGFKDPTPVVVVSVSGKEHRLGIGGPTPSGTDRYVRDEGSGSVYAVRGDFLRDLESGDTNLLERDVHDLKDADITSVRVLAGGKTREIFRRGPSSKRIWTDTASSENADETLSNWFNKVDRLKAAEYVSDPAGPVETVLRLEYAAKGTRGVFLDLAKIPTASAGGHPGSKSDYLVRTEHTRLWTKVFAPSAEQVEQDLGSVLK
jgi:hypothetical protein